MRAVVLRREPRWLARSPVAVNAAPTALIGRCRVPVQAGMRAADWLLRGLDHPRASASPVDDGQDRLADHRLGDVILCPGIAELCALPLRQGVARLAVRSNLVTDHGSHHPSA